MKILESYWEQSEHIIEGSFVDIFHDLSAITLKKRRVLKFLTQDLQEQQIWYKWAFPFMLILMFKSRTYAIRTE